MKAGLSVHSQTFKYAAKISHTYQIKVRIYYRLYWSVYQINSLYMQKLLVSIKSDKDGEICFFREQLRRREKNNRRGGGQDCLFTALKH